MSLYALHPYNHVKIYRVKADVDITKDIDFPPGLEIVFQRTSPDLSAATFVTREEQKPRWTSLKDFCRSEHDLFVVFYHRGARLLFINASRRNDTLYEHVAKQLSGGAHKILPLSRVNQVLIG